MFFISPILALFYPAFWRSLKEKGMGTGILYILYVTIIATVIGGFFLFKIPSKDVVGLIAPFSKVLPEKAVWTPAGLEVNDNKPFVLQYEKELFGVIDTSVEGVGPEEMEKYYIYITRGYAYVRDDKGGYRIVPITSKDDTGDVSRIELTLQDLGGSLPALNIKTTSREKTQEFAFSPGDVEGLIAKIWRYLAIFLVVFGLFVVFIWKFAAAMFYSLLALIINAILKTGASYEKLFCAAAFAMTPLIVIQALSIFVNGLSFLNGFWAGLAIVTAYLFAFILSWRKKEDVSM